MPHNNDTTNTNIGRRGEIEKFWYRSSRFFNANGEWYFDTRESTNVGPFPSESAAAQALTWYLQEINSATSSKRVALSRAKNHQWSITHYQ